MSELSDTLLDCMPDAPGGTVVEFFKAISGRDPRRTERDRRTLKNIRSALESLLRNGQAGKTYAGEDGLVRYWRD